MTDLREKLDNFRSWANIPGDPIREPRRSYIDRYHAALAKAWEISALVPAPAVPPAEQEPVAWIERLALDALTSKVADDRLVCKAWSYKATSSAVPLYAHPAPSPAVPDDVAVEILTRTAARADAAETEVARLRALLDAHTAAQPAPDAVTDAPVCRCGGAMSKNPHPDAGKPFTLLETGPVWVCIPCQSGTLHRWAERANAAENRIAAAQEALAKGPSA